MNLSTLYKILLEKYGHQGWWPLLELHEKGINPTKSGSIRGYHPKDYSYPKTKDQQFEIILGTILTQNTSWIQVEKVLINLKQLNSLSPDSILNLDKEKLKQAIKPAGYFNQKSERIILLAKWFKELNHTPDRTELLSLKGVGPETADSILLYAFKIPSFVVDTYTKRILTNLEIINEKEKYEKIQKLFHEFLPKDFKIYQEFHALLVEHAKHFYLKKENWRKDFLKSQ